MPQTDHQTVPTGSRCRRALRTQAGFTLLEVLIVVAIAALLAGLIPLAYNRIQDSAKYRDTVRSVWTALREQRDQAYITGRSTRFVINLQNRQFLLNKQIYTIPADLTVKTTVAEQGDNGQTASIWFLPQGGSTGGSIEILRTNGDGTRLRVDWLTGDITQEALLP